MVFFKCYLFFITMSAQVKDLDVELESTKQKNKENLQQAILLERERVTQMQWDMEELRRKCLEMESKLKSEQVFPPFCHQPLPLNNLLIDLYILL